MAVVANLQATDRLLIIGSSGSGKSNTAFATVKEDLLARGVPIVIFDRKGEYRGLPGAKVLKLPLHRAREISSMASFNVPLIIDLSGKSEDRQQEVVAQGVESLLNHPRGTGCQVLIDELHVFCPSTGNPPSRTPVKRLFSEGRSKGWGVIGVTQWITKVDNTATINANKLLIHRVNFFTPYLQKIIIDISGNEREEELIRRLPTGKGIYYDRDQGTRQELSVQLQKDKKGGVTPPTKKLDRDNLGLEGYLAPPVPSVKEVQEVKGGNAWAIGGVVVGVVILMIFGVIAFMWYLRKPKEGKESWQKPLESST